MGHTKFKDLADLSVELKIVGKLTGIKEKSPGIFYYKSIPFLHFHDKDGDRWADVKVEGDWVKIMVPFLISKKEKTFFLKKVLTAHKKIKS
jgi:hypothetical protein